MVAPSFMTMKWRFPRIVGQLNRPFLEKVIDWIWPHLPQNKVGMYLQQTKIKLHATKHTSVSVCVCVCERERDRQTQTDRDRDTDRERTWSRSARMYEDAFTSGRTAINMSDMSLCSLTILQTWSKRDNTVKNVNKTRSRSCTVRPEVKSSSYKDASSQCDQLPWWAIEYNEHILCVWEKNCKLIASMWVFKTWSDSMIETRGVLTSDDEHVLHLESCLQKMSLSEVLEAQVHKKWGQRFDLACSAGRQKWNTPRTSHKVVSK